MLSYRKSAALARKFDAAYPEELAARLQWWGKVLGLDQAQLLGLIGMSASQAAQRKGEDLQTLLEIPEWKANAQVVEGGASPAPRALPLRLAHARRAHPPASSGR
jgi:hypothetical protein